MIYLEGLGECLDKVCDVSSCARSERLGVESAGRRASGKLVGQQSESVV